MFYLVWSSSKSSNRLPFHGIWTWSWRRTRRAASTFRSLRACNYKNRFQNSKCWKVGLWFWCLPIESKIIACNNRFGGLPTIGANVKPVALFRNLHGSAPRVFTINQANQERKSTIYNHGLPKVAAHFLSSIPFQVSGHMARQLMLGSAEKCSPVKKFFSSRLQLSASLKIVISLQHVTT